MGVEENQFVLMTAAAVLLISGAAWTRLLIAALTMLLIAAAGLLPMFLLAMGERVQALAERFGFDDDDLTALLRRTAALLHQHARTVQRVAIWLLHRRRLSGRQLDRLVEQRYFQIEEVT
jgi:hypothetical protein